MAKKPDPGKNDLRKAQQQDAEAQAMYQSILESGEKTVNNTTKLTFIEDQV